MFLKGIQLYHGSGQMRRQVGFRVVMTADVVQSRNFRRILTAAITGVLLKLRRELIPKKTQRFDGPVNYRSAKAIERPDFTITESKSFEYYNRSFSGFATMMPGDVCSERDAHKEQN